MAWLVALLAAALRVEYGPLTAVAATVAMVGTAMLGVALAGRARTLLGALLVGRGARRRRAAGARLAAVRGRVERVRRPLVLEFAGGGRDRAEDRSHCRDELATLGRFAEPSLAILLALSDGPKHGYAIMADARALTGEPLGPGTLYATLVAARGPRPDRGAARRGPPAAVPADRRRRRRPARAPGGHRRASPARASPASPARRAVPPPTS